MIAKFLSEIKIKADDYGNLYAQMSDGTFRELLIDVLDSSFYGKIVLGKEVESEEAKGDYL